MKNINLNPGGIIGAILMLVFAIATVVLTSDPDSIGERAGEFGISALILGAFAGNYFWDRFFTKNE
jgi:hypothetical protein